MQQYSDGWSDWESQLNRKTERRRKSAASRTRKTKRTAIVIEILLLLAAASLMALESRGYLPALVSLPLALIAIFLMSFCAGFFVGAKNNK